MICFHNLTSDPMLLQQNVQLEYKEVYSYSCKFPNELTETVFRDIGAGRATDRGVIIDTESAISGAVDRPLDGAA